MFAAAVLSADRAEIALPPSFVLERPRIMAQSGTVQQPVRACLVWSGF